MENRLKERLTGAAILVALIVLVVPELFRGQRFDSSGALSGASEGPPIRSYTIDLGTSSHPAPLQTVSGLAPPASITASAPAAIPAPSPAASLPPATAVTPASAASGGATQTLAPAESSRGPPATAAAPAATMHGPWSVQLGLFAKRDNAERLMQAALGKGFDVALSGPDVKGHYHVHASTGFATRAAAEAWAQRLKSAGFASAVTAQE